MGAFLLVREALKEREVLSAQRAAYHPADALSCCRHSREMRSPFWLRLGLFIYDHLGGRKILPATQVVDLTHNDSGRAAQAGL